MRALIVIAACNEGLSLDSFLPRLNAAKAKFAHECNILVIDDGSTDNTAKVAAKHGCEVLRNGENLGIGSSLRKGYQWAWEGGYDVVVTMDADGQHDAGFLGAMLRQIELGAEIAVASRYHHDSERVEVPLDRDLLNVAVAAQMRLVTGWNMTDPLCGFWAMRRPWFEFALTHGRQERYGVHLEHLIKFWYLASPRPNLVEVPHPAIYANHGTLELLTRQYSSSNREDRVERFGTHALHIIQAMEDVRHERPGAVEAEMEKRRMQLK